MALVTLNITDDLREKLKREPNQSALVSELLRNYYFSKRTGDLEKQLADIEEKKKHTTEIYEKEKEHIVATINEKQQLEAVNKKEHERERSKAEQIQEARERLAVDAVYSSLNKQFKKFTQHELTKEMYEDYKDRHKEISFIQFIEEFLNNARQHRSQEIQKSQE